MPHFTLRDDWPPTTPGNVCRLCGSAQRVDDRTGAREPVVDVNVTIEWEGALAFCATCVVELGRLLGMASPDEADALRATATTYAARVDQAESACADLRTALEAWQRASAHVAMGTGDTVAYNPLGSGNLPVRDAETYAGRTDLPLDDPPDPDDITGLTDVLVTDGIGPEGDPPDEWPCGFEGCDRVLTSPANLARHVAHKHKET